MVAFKLIVLDISIFCLAKTILLEPSDKMLCSSPFNKIVSLLALFAAASFRLLPSINKVVISQQVLRYHIPSVEEIYREIKQEFTKDLWHFKRLYL